MGKTVCVIPARGGSKRLPRKNILPLAGKPLLGYAVESALQSGVFDEVIVSSDDDEILKIASDYGAIARKREPELSGDSATVFQVFERFLLAPENAGKYDVIAGMLPTSPFRTAKHVKEAFELFSKQPKEASLVSITAYDSPPQFGFEMKESNGHLKMINPEAFNGPTQSQRWPKIYFNNGAIWIAHAETYLKNHTFYKDPMVGYVMTDEASFDIDYPFQFEIAEIIAKKRLNESISK